MTLVWFESLKTVSGVCLGLSIISLGIERYFAIGNVKEKYRIIEKEINEDL